MVTEWQIKFDGNFVSLALSIIQSENEWFFFSTRGKKYPNGSQSKRATQSGYWKATGKERNVKAGGVAIGTKRTLVFHTGRAPRGERTEWIMHEYCMSDTSQESLVVCRLRRNGDFRLTESSKSSNDLRNLSTTDNDHYSGANENANIQRGGSDEGNPLKSCSKDSASSYMSHSVEQIESESDSDRQLIRHESTHGSSNPYKDCENEDDCFADIINDDIITLDESASHSLTFHGLPSGSTCLQPQESLSAQGAAVRRIKPRQQEGQKHEKQSSDCVQNQPSDQKPGCVVSVMAGYANTVSVFHPACLVLLFLFLMIMYVIWQCSYSKQPMGISMEVPKRQIKYWLHKAADYI
ncbi:NAC domain-containing protein [Artemisia annua]|uniref:NAC domain-containing protein n=1 Tax=Artemisia annua TaxID=35608 RepID=A0A2U1KD27_ARTAN|nr:NAC domain-containing protein [Artemisia annua]